ncbi:HAMP domain-containing sensor histidine kinase [Micromonospora sp. RP3T]|uniref:HAMP domain-containing sensor histidine kinase n=1 Tax=Micromonospora sp. RP3T TaxID=2135446 RepID=UPI003D72978E
MSGRRRSMQARLTLIATVAVTGTAVLVCALAWLSVRRTLIEQVDQELRAISHGPLADIDPASIPDIPSSPLNGPAAVQIQARLADGRTVLASPRTATLPFGSREEAVADGRTPSAYYSTSVPQGRFRVLVRPGANGSTMQYARSLRDVDTTLHHVALVMLALVLGAAMLAALAGRVMARAGLAPVHRLTRAATRVADTQDLDHPIRVDGDDEVGQLGRAFNRMLTALGRSRQAQRDLIEDAAHELRTPMSSMRTNVELLIHAGDRLDATDRSELLRDLDRQSVELSDLVADLVDLARSSGVEETAVTTDLAAVAQTAVDRARARTPYARIALVSRPAPLVGRPAALERAVVNLLDNAVKFGPPNQTVEVTVTGAPGGAVELSVADRADTIPAAERDRIFGRFHRLATARAVPGSGLGLAIVAQTVADHEGSVEVTPRAGGGNLFRLRLPAGASTPAR